MEEIELIKSLIEMTNDLPYRDNSKLDALKRRTEMIIKKIFGDKSNYLNDLKEILFIPWFAPSDEHDKNDAWNSGIKKMLNLLNVILEDIELSNNIENKKKGEKIINNNQNVFISYVKENSNLVDNLQSELESKGIEVWRDIKDLYPGDLWKSEIRKAIQKGNYFIACFSKEFCEKEKTYMNEELILAIDELRLRPTNKAWFIPVLLSDCEVPDIDIGGGKILRDIQFVKLYEDWDNGIKRIVKVIYGHKNNKKKSRNEEIELRKKKLEIKKEEINLQKKIIQKENEKEKIEHSKKLRDDILNYWAKATIHDDNRILSIKFPDYNKIKNSKGFLWTKQHIEENYPDLWNSWENANKLISKYNKRFKPIKEDIEQIIRKEVKETFHDVPDFKETTYLQRTENCYYMDTFFDHTWRLISSSIEIPEGDFSPHFMYDQLDGGGLIFKEGGTELMKITFRKYFVVEGDKTKFENTLNNILQNKEIREQIKDLIEIRIKCENETNKIKRQLDEIIEEIDHDIPLKGICDRCKEF